MSVTYLEISYPNFVLGSIINPEEANQNNYDIVTKINGVITAHNLNEENITNLGTTKADKTYVDTNITNLSTIIANHKSSFDHDSRYYTEAEMDSKITTINNSIVTHKTGKDHDIRYYTKEELAPWLRGGDTIINEEIFTIISSNNGDGTFTYNKNGAQIIGQLNESGHQIFKLVSGSYVVGSNRLEVIINDTLRRSVVSGGIAEIDTKTFALTSPEGSGAEITVRYYERIGMASEYTVKMGDVKPPFNEGKNMWFEVIG